MAIRSTAPSTPPTISAPLPRIETVCPSIVAVGTMTSVARRTSSLTSSGTGHPLWISAAAVTGMALAELGAEVIVGANVGANDPAAAIGAGGLAVISRSWYVDSDGTKLSTHPALNFVMSLLMNPVARQPEAHEQQPVHCQAHHEGG